MEKLEKIEDDKNQDQSNNSTSIKPIIFIIGGRERGITLSTIDKYYLTSNKWETSIPLSEPRGSLAAIAINDKVYIFGGGGCNCNLASCEVFDINTNKWTPIAPLTVPRHALSAIVCNNKIYSIGGWIAGKLSANIVESYDAENDKWIQHSELITARRLHAIAAYNECIYVFGGSTAVNSEIRSAECYNTLTDEWTEIKELPEANRPAAVTLGDYIYLILSNRYVLKYNPETNAYEFVENGKLPLPEWYGFSSVGYEGKLYVFGGTTKGKLTKDVYCFDTELNSWEKICQMPHVRRRSSAVILK
jgi:N-acetylneuraminic acid mutarotase